MQTTLQKFLSDVSLQLNNRSPEHCERFALNRENGLCTNSYRWCVLSGETLDLDEAFMASGLDETYPFNTSSDEYDDVEDMYDADDPRNEARLEWIEQNKG